MVDLGIKKYNEYVLKVKIYYYTHKNCSSFEIETLYLDDGGLRKLRDAVQSETFDSMSKKRAFIRLYTHKGCVDLNLCSVFKISYFECDLPAPKDKKLLAKIRSKITFNNDKEFK